MDAIIGSLVANEALVGAIVVDQSPFMGFQGANVKNKSANVVNQGAVEAHELTFGGQKRRYRVMGCANHGQSRRGDPLRHQQGAAQEPPGDG